MRGACRNVEERRPGIEGASALGFEVLALVGLGQGVITHGTSKQLVSVTNITTMTVFTVVFNTSISPPNFRDEEQVLWVGATWKQGLGALGQHLGNLVGRPFQKPLATSPVVLALPSS